MCKLNLVLLEPEIPQNTGNIARTCAATGATLHMIRPFGFRIDDAKLKRAGMDYWYHLDIRYYDGIEEFFEKNPECEFYLFTKKASKRHTDISYGDEVFFFFGRESVGLPEELLHENPDTCVRIPMRNELRSLNLSNSVAIAVYETLRQWDYPDLSREGKLTRYEW